VKKQLYLRIAVGLAAVFVTEIAIRITCGVTTPASAKTPERSLHEIPKEVGGWIGQDLPVDQPLFEHTGAVAMLDRNYANAIGDSIAADFGIWIGTEASLPHSPELCYSGAGWQIDGRKQVVVPDSRGGAQARILTLSKTAGQLRVLYCYQIGDHTVLDSNELRAYRQSLRGTGKPMPPVVKMMLQSNLPDAASAERQLVELASRLLPSLKDFQ
jgi:hypothetical protein